MNEQDKKIACEILGECFPEWEGGFETINDVAFTSIRKCKYCGLPFYGHPERPFTTDQDFTDLCKKLVEKGEWGNFYYKNLERWQKANDDYVSSYYIKWLFLENPERSCQLAVDYWKQNLVVLADITSLQNDK